MIRTLLRDKWAYLGAVVLVGGMFVLCACSSDFTVSGHTKTEVPAFLAPAVQALADATGIPWLKVAAGALASLGGAAVIVKRAVNAKDNEPYTDSDGNLVDPAAAEAASADLVTKPAGSPTPPVGFKTPTA